MAMRGGMYNANKRKKELARKKKQEEKRQKRQKPSTVPSQNNGDIDPSTNEPEASDDQPAVTDS